MRVIAADKILADFGHLCSDFIAAEGGQIIIQNHFSHQPCTTGGPIPHYNGGRNPQNPSLLAPGGKKHLFPNFQKPSFYALRPGGCHEAKKTVAFYCILQCSWCHTWCHKPVRPFSTCDTPVCQVVAYSDFLVSHLAFSPLRPVTPM